MKAEAEPGRRRRHEVISGGIPFDVVAIILSYLPLKSLSRFKAVSRAWRLFIQSLNLPHFFLGLFYSILSKCRNCDNGTPYYSRVDDPHKDIFRYVVRCGSSKGKGKGIDNNSSSSIIDPALSFLPFSPMNVIDSCNGLLLLFRYHYPDCTYYICNPLTKSWTQLHDLDNQFSRLEFDPMVSRNFKIVTFVMDGHPVLNIRVLSSETPTMTWKHFAPFRYRDPSVDERYFLMSMDQHHALWKGSLYLLFGSDTMNFVDAGRIMRLDLLENQVVHGQLIELPKGTIKPRNVGIGRSRNKLCFAGIDWINNNNNNHHHHHNNHNKVLRMRVWSLSKRDQTVWVLEHDSFITSHLLSPLGKNKFLELTYIGQFHPFLDVVFILFKNMVYAYDLKNLSLDEVCPIASDNWTVARASIFPFSPSPVDYSTKWTTKPRRRKLHIVKA